MGTQLPTPTADDVCMRSYTAEAHALLVKSTPEDVRSEAARLLNVARSAEAACLASPTEDNRKALRTALDASWPYTHALGLLRSSGR